MKNEVRKINFEGGELLGVRTEDGRVWLGIKKACLDIGLTDGQARRQVENIQDDVVLSQGIANLRLLTKGGEQEVLCLCEDLVTLWLAKIHLTPTMKNHNPETVEKLSEYQLKASKVLHEAFMATEEQKEKFFDELGIKGEVALLSGKIDSLESTIGILIDTATINSRQQQKILTAGRERVNLLLGGVTSDLYKKEARKYFKNMWNKFGEKFGVATYKDLNPMNVKDGYEFINNWELN